MQPSAPAAGIVVNNVGLKKVIVTPLPPSPAQQRQLLGRPRVQLLNAIQRVNNVQEGSRVKLRKLLLKAFSSKSVKKDWKMFTLRNVDASSIKSRDDLKDEIRVQLSDEIKDDFDVGYIQGCNLISVRTSQDVAEIWNGREVTLWCDGLKISKSSKSLKRKHNELDSDEYSDEETDKKAPKKSKKAKKEEKVEEIVTELKKKHGKDYSPMQYRIWGEMVGGDLHSSLEVPPNTSMFVRAGGETPNRKKDRSVAQALSLIADKMTPNDSPQKANSSNSSPARMIENRSKCYRQLMELHDLKSAGVLTEAEYLEEKRSVVQTLKSFVI